MTITHDTYTGLLVDSDAPCICHQCSGDSSDCPHHYPPNPRRHANVGKVVAIREAEEGW